MKNFKSLYSKTYTDQNQTLLVDNVKYHLGNNKKTMVRANGINQSTCRTSTNSRSTVHTRTLARTIMNRHRILKENNYQYNTFKSVRAKSKFRLILKKPNRFKFNRTGKLNGAEKSNLYKRIYNNGTKNEQVKNQIQQIRKKAVKSSINCLLRKNRDKSKNNKLKLSTINTTYCMFFCRFGKCARIDTCRYRHDKDKVAVCKNFLKGQCEINACLLSHKIDPRKMPVCSFFLKGICNTENSNCPYRHVNVSVNAEICKDFVRGFCNQGDQCKLLHQYVQVKCRTCKNKSKCECKIERRNQLNGQSTGDRLTNGESTNGQINDCLKSRLVACQESKSVDPVLIEISSSSDSDMEISDDDICGEETADCCLDFIPLTKDHFDVEEQDDHRSNGRRSNTPTANELNDNLNATFEPSSFDYDSDGTWFEDDGKTEFFQFIPEFLLN